MLVAPRLNHLVQNSASLYASSPAKPTTGQVPLINVELGLLVDMFGWSGAHEHAAALNGRYLDWGGVDKLVRAALKATSKT
ncbi:hypothetical protein GCM10011515_15410 [Tsuneonella deserti]|uniref:Uncharacterized protein n=1 Tax=Tsuneonella deserti TaxID=2035528 RepID=A0ABQ1S8U9_9SPHN|nr:hypothetical protein GCM10011515_15410 [Tsuneonella deserti]